MNFSLIQVVIFFWAGLLLWILTEYLYYRVRTKENHVQNEKLETSRKKKILWFTDTINDLNGVSVTLRNIGWLAHKRGDNIVLVSSILPDEDSSTLPPNVLNLKPITSFRVPFYDTMTIKVPNPISAMIQIYKQKPDEIYLSSPSVVGTCGLLFAKLFGVKTTAVYHTDFSMMTYNIVGKWNIAVKIVEFYTRYFHLVVDNLLVPSHEYIKILSKRGFHNKRMGIFYRGIDTTLFKPIKDAKNRIEEKYNIPQGTNLIFSGRISEDKNLVFLLDSIEPLLEKESDLHLIFAGNGPDFDSLKEKFNHNKQIFFLGRIENCDLPELYAGSDLLVFPSETDTFGMAVLEALACGTPALVSTIGGPSTIVENFKNGFVLDAQNRELWQNKISEITTASKNGDSSYATLATNTRNHVLENYDFYKILDNYVNDVTPTVFALRNKELIEVN